MVRQKGTLKMQELEEYSVIIQELGYSRRIGNTTNNVAEAWPITDGNQTRILVEADSEVIIELLDNQSADHHVPSSILCDLEKKIRVQTQLAKREAEQVSDFVIHFLPPPFVTSLYIDDLRGVSYPRMIVTNSAA